MNTPQPNGEVHPVAAMFPMMSDEELDELAVDIKENGLLNPIILDENGLLIDGRNRQEACRRSKIKPSYEALNGRDPIAFIMSSNVSRRHLNKGQQAMAVAMAYPEPEKGGRGNKVNSSETKGFSAARLSQARQVLHHSRELATAVLRDTEKLDNALKKVVAEQEARTSDEGKLEQLRKETPDLAELVAEERLPLEEAYATLEKRKHDAEEKEKNQRETIYRIAEDSYRTIIAWSSKEFRTGVKDRLEDKEFYENFIKRVRLKPTEIPSIMEGAKSLTEILTKL